MNKDTRRQKYEKFVANLRHERSSFEPHWRELSDYILPRRSRFFSTDVNQGDRRSKKIVDSTATFASRTLRSGMMSGMTSPARPWLRLTSGQAKLDEIHEVKIWLDKTTKAMLDIYLRSNLYNVLPIVYADIGVFGTSAVFVEEDFDTVLRAYPVPLGSYSICVDSKLRVNGFEREFTMTVSQIVEKYGFVEGDPTNIDWSNISEYVKNQWMNGNTEGRVEVCHVVKPNELHDPKKLESKYKKFASVYYEKGKRGKSKSSYLSAHEKELFLSERGYDNFPILAPRWEVTGEDAYATSSPGMIALGDIKQLQSGEKTSAKGIQKQVDPPMVGPSALQTTRASILPGDITYVDETNQGQTFREAHQVRLDINALEGKQEQVRRRIQKAFYEDLFLMLASSDRRQITATEINERHEEKLLALGPVLEQLNQDLLDPLVDLTFEYMIKQDYFAPGSALEPPDELQNMELKVEYESIMAQAQKIVGLGSIERFSGFIGQVAQADPGVLDKINSDKLVDVYGDITSIPTGILRSDDDVEEIRAQRAQAQQQQAQAEQQAMATQSMKNLSETDMSEDTALGALMDGSSKL